MALLHLNTRLVSNITYFGRVAGFTSLVYMGNFNGVIGYARARARDPRESFRRAVDKCKQNLVAIDLDLFNTMPTHLFAKYNGVRMELQPRKEFNSWGSLRLGTMLQMAGIHHCMFDLVADEYIPQTMVFCLMRLLTQNSTPKHLAEQYGIKSYESVFGNTPTMKRYPKVFDYI